MRRDEKTAPPTLVYTIGHGAEDFGRFQQRCAPHGITTVVDVRSQPYSRHAPDFGKESLEALCAEAGLGYRWLGAHLGGRATDPALRSDGRPNYRAMRETSGFRAGIAELEGLAATGTVVVLCAETEAANCHRTLLIAPELADTGHEVRHITGDGALTHYQPRLEW